MTETTGNRKYKDRLLRSIFREKEDLLSLYNAINGSSCVGCFIFPGCMLDMWSLTVWIFIPVPC